MREAAGLFDVSHMGEFFVQGPQAELFLDKLVVNRIAGMSVGKAVYSPMCASDGGVVDDLIVYRTADDAFLVCVNASNIEKDFGWFLKQAERWELELTIEDQSADYALLALQGPQAEVILSAAGFEDLGTLKRFWHREIKFADATMRICRTGYTGEDGFEIYISPAAVEALATKLMTSGADFGLKLCGLGARDSLRLEAGLPLYGHELSDQITPLEASLDWTVKLNKEDFMGKNALSEQAAAGVPRRVVHFKLDGRRIARQGTSVVDAAGKVVGEVLSGTLSPMTESPIGSAIVDSAALTGALAVDLRGNQLPLQIAKAPLHKA